MSRQRGINLLAHLIERLEPDPYYFRGHQWRESAPFERQPVEFCCEFTHDDEALVADWGRSSFELRVPFRKSSLSGAVAELFIRGFGHIRGELIFVEGQVIFDGRNDAASVFAHIYFEEDASVNLVGGYELKGQRHLYSICGIFPHDPESGAKLQLVASG
jgi:hypothetical protein